jgi:hypothetical protein
LAGILRLKNENHEIIERKAPDGQRHLHQSLGTKIDATRASAPIVAAIPNPPRSGKESPERIEVRSPRSSIEDISSYFFTQRQGR